MRLSLLPLRTSHRIRRLSITLASKLRVIGQGIPGGRNSSDCFPSRDDPFLRMGKVKRSLFDRLAGFAVEQFAEILLREGRIDAERAALGFDRVGLRRDGLL